MGKIAKTATGLKKTDLVKNKSGKIVSRKKSMGGKKNSWIVACNKARAALKIKGFTGSRRALRSTRRRRSSSLENHVCLFPWRTGRLLWVAGASCSLSERWAWTPPLGPNMLWTGDVLYANGESPLKK